MKIRPLQDRILVERIEEEQKGKILLPDTAKEKPQAGKVIAVGEGRRNEKGELIPVPLKVGDKILFNRYAGNEVKIEGKEYLIMREDEVLGIIEE